jgi:hypothetical protein
MGVYMGAVPIWQDNTNTCHILTKYTYNKKAIGSQSYTNSEGHITANEYIVDKEKEVELSLMQALEAY